MAGLLVDSAELTADALSSQNSITGLRSRPLWDKRHYPYGHQIYSRPHVLLSVGDLAKIAEMLRCPRAIESEKQVTAEFLGGIVY